MLTFASSARPESRGPIWNRRLPLRTPGGVVLVALLVALLPGPGCSRYTRIARTDLIQMGPAGVLEQAAAKAGRPLPLRVTGTLQIRHQGGSLSAQCLILYAEPDSVRFDVSGFLGVSLLQAVVTGTDVEIYSPTEAVVLEGAFDPNEMMSIGGYPFHPSIIWDWVLGPGIARDWEQLASSADQFDLGIRQITIGARMEGGHRMVVVLDTDLFYQEIQYLDAEGDLLWETTYDDFKRVRGSWLPGKVGIRYPDADTEVIFTVGRRSARPRRTPGDLRLAIPAGVRRITIRPASGAGRAP